LFNNSKLNKPDGGNRNKMKNIGTLLVALIGFSALTSSVNTFADTRNVLQVESTQVTKINKITFSEEMKKNIEKELSKSMLMMEEESKASIKRELFSDRMFTDKNKLLVVNLKKPFLISLAE
jgi:hypothetical protein